MKKRVCLALAVTMIMGMGCSSESDDFSFSIYADPSRTHAPGDVKFELTRDDGTDVKTCQGKWDFGDGITLSGDYEAEHRYREAGNYKVAVSLECGDQKAHASADVTVYGTVDLSVSALEARPLDVSSDGSVNVSFQVANSAKDALRVPTYIDIYMTPTASDTAYLEAGSKRIYRHMLSGLGAAGDEGAVEKIELDIPRDASIRTGAYYITAVINPDRKVGESNFNNNVVFSAQEITLRNQATDGADFVAKRLSVSPAVTSVLTGATAQFDILNEGSTTAEAFAYEIWLGAKDNAEDMTGAVKIHESSIVGGMSGVEQNIKNVLLSVVPAVSEPGLYYFWLILDTTNIIVERDETNNIVRSSSPVQVTFVDDQDHRHVLAARSARRFLSITRARSRLGLSSARFTSLTICRLMSTPILSSGLSMSMICRRSRRASLLPSWIPTPASSPANTGSIRSAIPAASSARRTRITMSSAARLRLKSRALRISTS